VITYLLNRWGQLVDRFRTGTWCTDHRWGPWHMIDLGRNKVRHCDRCGWTEFAL
jgi:hypothetical protein